MLKINTFIAALFVLLCTGAWAQVQNIDRVIAIVGDRPILYSEVEMQRIQAISQGINPGPNAKGTILDNLIYQYLLIHHAELDSLEVSEAQVNNEMEGRIRFFENQIGGRKKLEEFYGKTIAEIKEEFYDMIKDKLLSQAMERKITEEVKVTPHEIRTFYEAIPKDSLPFINSQIEIAHITLIPKVSDEEKKRVKEKLQKVRDCIMKGDCSFCVEALDSDDPGSRSRCGEWDFVPRGTFVPQFDAIAFRLKDGEFSEVFETAYGYHFMQLIQRRGEEYKGRHILFVPKVSSLDLRKASSRLDSVYQLIKDGKMSFERAAELFSDDEESKQNGGKIVNPETGESKFDVGEMDPQLFLTLDRMNINEVSLPVAFTTSDGKSGFRVIKLLKRTSPHRANLIDDYQLIQGAAQNDKQNKAVDTWVRSKIYGTYIWVAEDFRNYTYQYPWIKKED